MAKKERQRRSARQARQRERVAHEAQQEAAASSDESKGSKKVARSEGRKPAASSTRDGKEETPKKKGRIRTYFGAVRGELHRVSWPSRSELTNYSVAVIVALVVVGVIVWLVDTGFLNLMFQFTKLRG